MNLPFYTPFGVKHSVWFLGVIYSMMNRKHEAAHELYPKTPQGAVNIYEIIHHCKNIKQIRPLILLMMDVFKGVYGGVNDALMMH